MSSFTTKHVKNRSTNCSKNHKDGLILSHSDNDKAGAMKRKKHKTSILYLEEIDTI